MANNYINNKEMYKALCEYNKRIREAEEQDLEKPKIPDYLGECFLLIANRLATRPNFSNYTYIEEMILDGIENCIMVIDNFDCEKYSNPFAYFTQIIWFAFLRRIEKEKKQTYIKYKSFQELNAIGDLVNSQDTDVDVTYTININDEYMNNLIETFENNKEKKKKKPAKKGLENFIKDDEDDNEEQE